ncbi:MAG TPA: ATPase, T2SS/T4P/T4SS family [Desulfobacterales bacterium]|nr:ATPase, T2SS/T4P/T4SS family [Desulfobacterales bacterium]
MDPQPEITAAADTRGQAPTADQAAHAQDIVDLLVQASQLTREQLAYAHRVRSKLDAPRPVLEVLKELKLVSEDQIKEAVRQNKAPMCLGNLLVELGHIQEEDLRVALTVQNESKPRKRLGEILLERRLIDERALIEVLSLQMGFPYVDPDFSEIDPRLFFKVPAKWYETHNFVPVRMDDGKPLIAFADPLDKSDLDAAREVFGPTFTTAIARRSSIERAIKRVQRAKQRERISPADEGSIIALVNSIVAAAVERKASDIHLEPLKDHIRVRFRQDGVLIHYDDFPSTLLGAMTNRLKVMCDVDITEKRRHQGGRFFFEQGDSQLDLRASFYVTVHGEKIVLRLLNRQGLLINLEDVGMSSRMLERFKENALYLPSGVILITGPTGSGKTTTVYGCINHINDPQTSIITAEEPVEYVIDGISQCSINPRIQLTFEETLRHIVRQDPDVIVIGEIRDTFSAEVAVQAALTGHKVITTFHTEDSIGGLVRLLNMNIEAFLISSTVVSVMAQRLLRKVCSNCAAPYRPTPLDLQRLGYGYADIVGAQFQRGQGCAQCQYTGYRGRAGIFELLILNEEIRTAIIEHKTSQEIRRISIEASGLVTLLEDGMVKAAAGLTTIDELLRCLPRLQRPRPLPELRRLLEV